MWSYDLDKGGYGLAAVPESLNKTKKEYLHLINDNLVKYEDYFNSDVLIIKPSFFKENALKILNGVKFVFDHRYGYAEQYVLNYLFSDKYLKLPLKFNFFPTAVRLSGIKLDHLESCIIHFAGDKPDLNTDDIFNRIYLEYFMKTEWWTNLDFLKMFGVLHNEVKKIFEDYHNETRNILLHFTNLLSKRKRAFLYDKNFTEFETLQEIFKINETELVMEFPTTQEELNKFVALKGTILLFIFMNDYKLIRISLLNHGFIENEDFVDGTKFLSENYGVNFKFDSQKLLQSL